MPLRMHAIDIIRSAAPDRRKGRYQGASTAKAASSVGICNVQERSLSVKTIAKCVGAKPADGVEAGDSADENSYT
jgi:hypothetical protein